MTSGLSWFQEIPCPRHPTPTPTPLASVTRVQPEQSPRALPLEGPMLGFLLRCHHFELTLSEPGPCIFVLRWAPPTQVFLLSGYSRVWGSLTRQTNHTGLVPILTRNRESHSSQRKQQGQKLGAGKQSRALNLVCFSFSSHFQGPLLL